jgi:hypothetical protein
MSVTTTNVASDDTLIHDSQLGAFSAFKERISFCCCRLLKKTSNYDLSSVSKDIEEQQDKPSYVNQAFQVEKQARRDKLEKIAKTLPGATSNGAQGLRTPISFTQTPTRSIKTVTQETPRSGLTLAQTRPPTSTPISKTGISTLNKPSPLATNTKNNEKNPDETNTGFLFKKFRSLKRKTNILFR